MGGGETSADGGETSAGGGATVPLRRKVCGGTTCTRLQKCCTAADTCGLIAPTQIFVSECVSAEPRGGTVAASCPRSAEYCERGTCQSFAGCTQSDGECGYWIDSYKIVGGQEVLEVSAALGCVAPAEVVQP